MGTNPLLPATYDLVWSVVVVLALIAVVALLVAVSRLLRRRPARVVVARTEELVALRDSGQITPEEYAERRRQLIR